jgi:hypothetical protein
MAELVLRLADISPDDVYSFSYPHLPERWGKVMGEFPGLPLLIVDEARRVVCGRDYLSLLQCRGDAWVRAWQVDLAPVEALLLNYHVSNRLFGLNLYEKLLFCKKILPWLSPTEIQRRAELDFTLNEFLCRHLDMLLDEPFRSSLVAGRLGLKAALQLAAMVEPDRLAFAELFQACKFSESQQAQLIQMLEETAFREKKSLAGVLAALPLADLLQQEMPQKKILEAASGLRYPAFAQAEREWRDWQKKMKPASGLSLAHAPLFTSNEIRITLTAGNRAQAEKLLAKLKKII